MGYLETSRVCTDRGGSLPSGKMYHIACKTWFTSTGAPRPLSFKLEGDDGQLMMVSDITILYTEDKSFSGITCKEYGCEAIIGGLIREFRLIFYCEACKWIMLI